MFRAHILTIRALEDRALALKAGTGKKDLQLLEARRRVIATLSIVVATFVICWTPDQFSFLIYNIGLLDSYHLHTPLNRSFILLGFVNSCANPFIYAARNPNFRRALKELCGVSPKTKILPIFAADCGSKDLASTNPRPTDISKVSGGESIEL